MADLKTEIADDGDKVVINRAQDVEPILDYAKAQASESSGWSPSRELKLNAVFPFVLVEKYLADNGVSMAEFMANPEHVKRMMADPALSDFNIGKNTIHRSYR